MTYQIGVVSLATRHDLAYAIVGKFSNGISVVDGSRLPNSDDKKSSGMAAAHQIEDDL